MKRESHVRFCERLGVKFPEPTRRRETEQLAKPQATAPFLELYPVIPVIQTVIRVIP